MDNPYIIDHASSEGVLETAPTRTHADDQIRAMLVRSQHLLEQLGPELFKIKPSLAIQIEDHIQKVRGLM